MHVQVTIQRKIGWEKLNASAELIETVLNLSECNEEDVRSSEVKVQKS